MKTSAYYILFFFLALTSVSYSQPYQTKWERAFDARGLNGTFILYNSNNDELMVYNKERSDSTFSPASTFKICNALIGLATGTMKSVDDTIPWNGHQYSFKSWNKDHCLRTAMPASCVWFYQEMARRIGRDSMQYYLDLFDYGNKNIGEQVDLFWLNGDMTISPKAQVDFLHRLINHQLPVKSEIQEAVKEILITEKTEHYTMYAKTGWAMRLENQIGWYVGFVETEDNTYIFVLNYDMTHPKKQAKYRKELTYELLKLAGVI